MPPRKLTREGKPFRTDAARYLDKSYGLKAVRAHVTDAFKVRPGTTLEEVLFGLRQAANLTLRYAPIRGVEQLDRVAMLARYAVQFDHAWKQAKKDQAGLDAIAMAPLPAKTATPAARKNAARRRR
jgi:hypothetical protein